ncbi:MAG: caspase family protein [Muribaculaceae bacterium]|nr:caspase family protein [Muribaculaceae bacterium]
MNRTLLIIVVIFSLFSTISAENRALLVGIGKYDTRKTGWSVIHGDNDVDMLTKYLINSGYKETNIKCLKNGQATKAAIVNALKELAMQCRQGDKVIFHFSGHGQPISDLNGDEKKKPFDEAIVPYDAYRTRRYKIGNNYYNGENHLIDDELNHLINNIKKKIGKKGYLLVSFDACYSEGMEMAKSMINHNDVKKIGPIRGTADILRISRDSKVARIPRPKMFSDGAKMAVVSACRDYERNYEYHESGTNRLYGSLSYCLMKLIETGLSMNKWENFFKEEKYKDWDIFMSEQHPTITIYE